jgi:hypothetical protein
MTADLSTTNLFLGIIAFVAVLQVAAVIALAAGVFNVSRKIAKVVETVDENHIAPAGAQLHAILDDVKNVTAALKTNAAWIDALFSRVFRRS